MGSQSHQSPSLWKLARSQHGVVSREQLLELDFTPAAIAHRLKRGRLHPLHRGVFAVGRPEVGQCGRWMAALLACGPSAVLSHRSAAELWEIRQGSRPIEVSLLDGAARRVPGVQLHRRSSLLAGECGKRFGIRVTSPIRTLTDLATQVTPSQLEAAVNEADKRDLVTPEALREALEVMRRQPGVGALRRVLDRRTFALTDSALERRFLRLVRSVRLPTPQTGVWLNGFRVDFFWPGLGLVVETDGLRYHRTPAQQARDRRRDQAHTAAGLTTLRFTHAQVRFEPDHVCRVLARLVRRLSSNQAT
jgi:very-short-patch-repair endonuclease